MSSDLNWPDRLKRLPSPLPPVEPFRFELLPRAFREYVKDEAARMSAPPEMIAAALMVAAGSVVGRACGVRPKRIDTSWVEIPNIWGMIVADPSTMKTPASRAGLEPLRVVESEALQRHEQASASNAIRLDLLRERIAHVKRRKDADLDELQQEVSAAQEEIDALTPKLRRFVTSDATIEKLSELARDNPRGLLVYRDELSGLLCLMERAERAGDRAFYLEGWSGHGTFTVDRIGRGTTHVRGLCLSIFGTTQPNKIRDLLVRPALAGGSGDDGFVQRFSMVVCPDIEPDWRYVDRARDDKARGDAFGAFARLAEMDPTCVGARPGSPFLAGVPTLGLKDQALETFIAWLAENKHSVRSPGMRPWPSFAAHLEKFSKLVPALALVGHLVDVVSGYAEPDDVSGEAMGRAAAWAEYLKPHAQRLYGVELHPGRAVLPLLEWRIEKGHLTDGMLVRDLLRKCWQGLANRDQVLAGLTTLERLGWLRLIDEETEGRTRRVIRLHPKLIDPPIGESIFEEACAENRDDGGMEDAGA